MNRRLLLVGAVVAVLLVTGIAVVLVAQDDATEVVESPPLGTVSTATTASDAPECLPVSPYVRELLGIDTAAAVAAPEGVWYVSDGRGATWATTLDPEAPAGSGAITPLNEAARATTESPPLAIEGIDDASLEAVASRGCATGG